MILNFTVRQNYLQAQWKWSRWGPWVCGLAGWGVPEICILILMVILKPVVWRSHENQGLKTDFPERGMGQFLGSVSWWIQSLVLQNPPLCLEGGSSLFVVVAVPSPTCFSLKCISFKNFIYFKKFKINFFNLAVPQSMWDLSSPIRDQTCNSCIGSAKSFFFFFFSLIPEPSGKHPRHAHTHAFISHLMMFLVWLEKSASIECCWIDPVEICLPKITDITCWSDKAGLEYYSLH